MAIRNKIKAILADENFTMKALAEELSKNKDKKITLGTISKKLAKDTVKYREVEEILEVLGYRIIIEKSV